MITVDRLHDVHFLKDVSDEVLAELCQHCRTVELDAGDMLFRQGDPADSFYIVEAGQVHIVCHYDNDEDLVLATLGPYDVFGEMSMLAQENRAVSAIAVSDCVLTVLDTSDFMAVMQQHPEMSLIVLTQIGRYLHHLHLNVHEYSMGEASERLASVLLLMADNQTVTLRKHLMARAAGVDYVWLDQTLKAWNDKGYIEIDDKQVTIKDVDALKQL